MPHMPNAAPAAAQVAKMNHGMCVYYLILTVQLGDTKQGQRDRRARILNLDGTTTSRRRHGQC